MQIKLEVTPRPLVSLSRTSFTFDVVQSGSSYGFNVSNKQDLNNFWDGKEVVSITPSVSVTTSANSSGYIRMPDGKTYRVVTATFKYENERQSDGSYTGVLKNENEVLSSCGSDRLATKEEAEYFIRLLVPGDSYPDTLSTTCSRNMPSSATLKALGLDGLGSSLYLYPELSSGPRVLCVKQ